MHKTVNALHKTPSNLALANVSAPSVVLTAANTYTARQHQNFPSHYHDVWELIYYQTGYIECVVAGTVFRTRPGMLLVIPPGATHYDRALTAYSQIYVHVRGGAAAVWSQLYLDDQEHTLAALFAGLVREWQGDFADRAELLAALLRQLELTLGRQPHVPGAAERLVRRAERILAEQLGSPLTVKEVAAALGVSPSTLRAQFVKLRGYPPKFYQQQKRRERALELIGSSNLSLGAVADLCGFDSAGHLSRSIKGATGRTPGSFRAARLAG